MRKYVYILSAILCGMVTDTSFGQNYADKEYYLIDSLDLSQLSIYDRQLLDSCLNLYHSSNHDTTRVKALNGVCGSMVHEDWTRYQFFQYDLINDMLEKYKGTSSSEVIRSLKIDLAFALNNMGFIYKDLGNITTALDYFNRSLALKEEIGDKKGMAVSYSNIGYIFKNQGDIPTALEYYHKGLKIQEELNDKYGMAYSFNSIGYIYDIQGDTDLALEYYNKSLVLRKELGDKKGLDLAYNNIGFVYKDLGKLTTALDYFMKALEIQEELGIKKGMATSYHNIGSIYELQGNDNEALKYYNKGLLVREELGDKADMASSYNNIGGLELKMGGLGLAQEHLNMAHQLAEELGYPNLIYSSSKNLSDLFRKQGNYQEALEMFEQSIQMRDSMNSMANQKAIIQQQYEYEYEKKAAADSIKAMEEVKVQQALLAAEKAETEKQKLQVKQQEQQKYYLFGGLTLALLFGGFIFNRFRLTRKQKDIIEEQKTLVEQKKAEVESQKQELQSTHEQLEEHHKEIQDSIKYAKRIQEAIMPSIEAMNQVLQNGFVLYIPKDVVAGDFYWMELIDHVVYYAAADCTGHGVPGAMVSVVCSNALTKALLEEKVYHTGKLLDRTREIVIERLAKSGEEMKDGMDISLCALNMNTKELKWSGANNPLWILRKEAGEIEEIRADKQPIGKYTDPKPFTEHSFQLGKGDTLITFTDGYQDQFGGPKGKKFKATQLKQLILENRELHMNDLKELLLAKFKEWQGDQEQIDDVCIIGVSV